MWRCLGLAWGTTPGRRKSTWPAEDLQLGRFFPLGSVAVSRSSDLSDPPPFAYTVEIRAIASLYGTLPICHPQDTCGKNKKALLIMTLEGRYGPGLLPANGDPRCMTAMYTHLHPWRRKPYSDYTVEGMGPHPRICLPVFTPGVGRGARVFRQDLLTPTS